MEISLWSFPKETVKGTYWISFGVCYKLHVRSYWSMTELHRCPRHTAQSCLLLSLPRGSREVDYERKEI